MTALGAQQERQLLLIERMSGKMDAICDSQKRLQDANASLRQENERLRDELQKKEKQGNRRGLRNSRRSSTVEIPNELRKRFRFIYKKLVEKKMLKGFIVDEDPSSEGNQIVFTQIKEILRKEHGGENCPWTELQMEAQFCRYFTTIRERDLRIRTGKNKEHKEKCKKNRRLLTKLERRNRAFELVQSSMTATQRQCASEVLFIDYMSSEESDYDEIEDPITGEKQRKLARYHKKRLPWERSSLKNLKQKLDRAYHDSLSLHARAMSKAREVHGVSTRPAPEGPAWAVRQIDTVYS